MTERILFHAVTGQSNSEAGGLMKLAEWERVATHGQPDPQRAIMFQSGYLGSGSRLIDWSKETNFVPGEESRRGETGGASFSRKMLSDADAIGLDIGSILYRTFGQAAQSLEAISKDSAAFENLAGGL